MAVSTCVTETGVAAKDVSLIRPGSLSTVTVMDFTSVERIDGSVLTARVGGCNRACHSSSDRVVCDRVTGVEPVDDSGHICARRIVHESVLWYLRSVQCSPLTPDFCTLSGNERQLFAVLPLPSIGSRSIDSWVKTV